MAVVCLTAKRSKDPSSQVGACIVDEDKKIVGVGYALDFLAFEYT